MTPQSTSIQVVAGMLATLLLVVPAGTSLAICLSLDHGDTGEQQGPSQEVVVHFSDDCCPGKIVIDTDSALQLDVRTSVQGEEAPFLQGLSSVSTAAVSPESISRRTRAPPQPRRPEAVISSLRTVVLLV